MTHLLLHVPTNLFLLPVAHSFYSLVINRKPDDVLLLVSSKLQLLKPIVIFSFKV